LLLKAFAFGEFLSFINAAGIDPSGRQSRSNAKAFVLRQKKETKEKATPDRSKARNKINSLRRWRNSQFASVELLKHSPLVATRLKPQTIDFKAAHFTGPKAHFERIAEIQVNQMLIDKELVLFKS
jgi:hypothetical protein